MKWKIGNIVIKNQIVFAPMAGVSNKSYRSIIKEMGAGLIYSEMISTMGIKYNSKKTIDLAQINESERPIAVQIFGNDAEGIGGNGVLFITSDGNCLPYFRINRETIY